MNGMPMSEFGTSTQPPPQPPRTQFFPNRISTRYRFADLELDLGRRQLLRGNRPLKLTKLTFNLLTVLVELSPNVVRHDELAALAWGKGRIVTPETIAQRMMILRRSLYDSAERPRYIEGVRGQGYRLLVDVEPVAAGPTGRPAIGLLTSAHDGLQVTADSEVQAPYLQAPDLCSTSHHALALDASLGVTAVARAGIAMQTWRWSQAQHEFAHVEDAGWANDVSPWFYCWCEDPAAGLRRARRNLALRPNSWIAHRDLGITLCYAGDRRGAAAALAYSAHIAPANPVTLAWRAYLQVASGNTPGARGALGKVEQALQPRIPLELLPELAYAYARIGDANRAERLFGQIHEHARRQDVGCGAWAMAMLALGDVDAARLWLARAAEKARRHEPDPGFLNLMNLKMNFLADPTLEMREFAQLLARIRGN
jgi:DNA-binding winged helix-turn-helix (wHTH) protein